MKKYILFSIIAFVSLLTAAPAWALTYTTNFPLTENPISEGGNWISGEAVGIDWGDVFTTRGHAVGTDITPKCPPNYYCDNSATLMGTWGTDQSVQAVVYSAGAIEGQYEEVSLRLRQTIAPHYIQTYEIFGSVSPPSRTPYICIARWEGPYLDFPWGDNYFCMTPAQNFQNGDVFKATIIGGTITVYKNGTQMLQYTDPDPITSGSPGIGMDYGVANPPGGHNADFGFSSFTATDGAPCCLDGSCNNGETCSTCAMGGQIDFCLIRGSLVIEAEDASIKTAGGIIGGDWCLWSNGILGENVHIPAAGTYEVVVRAFGSPLGGIWPLMALSVDGLAGQSVTVDSAGFTDYSFQVELTPGVHSIGVAFLNDAYNPGVEDRNLCLDKFAIYSPLGIAKPELASK